MKTPVSMRGFSLLEMIVVLAILSLVLVAVAPLVNPWRRGALIDVAAHDVAIALRAARATAIYGNKLATFTFDGTAGQYWSDTAPARGTLPPRIIGTFIPGETAHGRIQLFPDGGASGGTILLREAHRSAAIQVNALSGRTKVNVGP